MTFLAHVADRVLGRPLMLTQEKAEILLQVLDGRISLGALDGETLAPLPEASQFVANRVADSRMARVTESGIAVLPIIGTLVHRGAWIGASSGLISYEGLQAQLAALAKDGSVKGILLDINSPGGEASSGAFDLPKLIREIRGAKPVVAVANDMICSAAYSIASGASEIWVNDLSVTGSIGVIMVHLDRSAEMTIKGVKPTIIRSDGDKAQGNSLEPLSQEAFGLFKAEVDRIKTTFVDTVASGRRGLTDTAIRALGAAVFHGADAIDKGLADKSGTFFDALAAVEALASRSPRATSSARRAEDETKSVTASEPNSNKTETEMSEAQQSPASDAVPAPGADKITAADHVVEAATSPAQEAQARIEAILDCPEAKGREALARHLAFKTQTPAPDAIATLKAAPQGRIAADPIVGAGVTQGASPSASKDGVAKGQEIVARVRAARGFAATSA